MRIALLFLIMLVFMVYMGQMVATAKPQYTLLIIFGLVVSMLTIMDMELGLYILIFVIPFTLQYQVRRQVEVGTDDLLLIFLILSWFANKARSKENVIVYTPLNWPFFIFFLCGVISLIPLSTRYVESQWFFVVGSLHLLKFFEYVFIYFIVTSCIKELPQVKKFTIAFFINVGVVAAVQLIQNIFGGPIPLDIAYLKGDIVRYGVSTFGSNAILGAFYCFAISIALGLVVRSPLPKVKIPLTIFSVIISYALFYTFSRSAYVGIMTSIIIIVLMVALKERKFLFILLGLVLLSPLLIQRVVMERLTSTVQIVGPQRIQLDLAAQARVDLWGQALKIFMENPIFGVGYWGVRHILWTEAHSQFLTYLTEMGIVGFCVFLWLMSRIFKLGLWVKNNAQDTFVEGLGLGYVAGLAAVLVTCIFSETLEAFRMLGALWFMTGLVASAQNIISTQPAQAAQAAES